MCSDAERSLFACAEQSLCAGAFAVLQNEIFVYAGACARFSEMGSYLGCSKKKFEDNVAQILTGMYVGFLSPDSERRQTLQIPSFADFESPDKRMKID